MTRLTGPNGLETTWSYDSFGRKTAEQRADGTQTTWSRNWVRSCKAPHPEAIWCLRVKADGAGLANTQFDKYGREVRKVATSFDGRYSLVDKQYDRLGRQTHASQPYFEDSQPSWTISEYDALDRVVKVTTPGPRGYRISVTTEYAGMATTVTNPKGERKTTTTDVLGRVLKVVEPLGATVAYDYDAVGNLVKTVDPKGAITTLSYNVLGHKTAMNDPAMGAWRYGYNAAGELTSQIDAKGQKTRMTYDALGRLVSRHDAEGTSTWQYDTAPNGVGKLAKVSSQNAFSREHRYDSKGRPSETQTRIDGKTFSQQVEYDAVSRVATVKHPMGFQVKHDYNEHGYLLAVKSPKGLIQDYERRHIQGLMTKTLDRINELQKKADEQNRKAGLYRSKAQRYKYFAHEFGTDARDRRIEGLINQASARVNGRRAELERREALTDQAAANREKATADSFKPRIAWLRRAADINQANAASKLSQAHHLDHQANLLEREASSDRSAAVRQYEEGRKDSLAAVQLFAAAARLNAIAVKLEGQARYWQTQTNIRYNTLKQVGGGVRCFNFWGSWGRRFCYDLGAIMRRSYEYAAQNARNYVYQARSYRFQAVAQQAEATRKSHDARQHYANGVALFRQSASKNSQASDKRDQADSLQNLATRDLRVARWQDAYSGVLERDMAKREESAAQLQAQANQHAANAQNAAASANRQRAVAQTKLAESEILRDRAHEQLVLMNRELAMAKTALANAERYGKEVEELERMADSYQAILGDEDYAVFWRAQERDAAGRLTSALHGNGLRSAWHYDQTTGTLDRIETGLQWDALRELAYEYDDHSNVVSRRDLVNDLSEDFQYDRLDRLIQSRVSSDQAHSAAYNATIAYQYDLAGNMTYKSDVGSYTYSGTQPSRLARAGTQHTDYAYDANGNVTRGGGRTFVWASHNKPTRMTKGDARVSFAYDPERAR